MVSGSLGKIGELQVKRVESESGFWCFEWRIPYNQCLPASGDSHYRSDSFQVLGKWWHLTVRPGTTRINVHLVKEESSTKCSVTYEFRFKRTGDTLPNEFTGGTGDGIFGTGIFGTGIFGTGEYESCPISAQRSTLERRGSDLVSSGAVTIVCIFKKLAPYPVTPESHVVTVPGCEKLSLDLNELMLSGNCSDFTVQVKGEEFRLHRAILSARSPVFQAMFEHDMTETQTGRVSVDDCEPDEFRAFVRYVYTGRSDQLDAEIVFGLFALADKYQVDELKSPCLEFITSTLSVETLGDAVQLALTYDNRELLDRAFELVSNNALKVMKTEKWKKFFTANPIRANEFLLKALDRKKR